jgi:hypothetical protein
MDVRKSQKYVLEQTKCTDHNIWVFCTAATSRMDGPMKIITCCVRSGAYEQDLQTQKVRGNINRCSVVVNTSNDEKQVCSVHHGKHKNSYSPCGGWYNASTDALVAMVTRFFFFLLDTYLIKTVYLELKLSC